MVTAPRKVSRLAWLVIAIPLGAGAIWALVPGDSSTDGRQIRDDDRVDKDEQAAPSPANRLERFGQAMDLLRKSRPEAQAAPASPDMLSVLFSGEDAPSRLGLVLTAVEANPTPPEQDPLWGDLVQGISSLWNADTMNWGLDLMFSEARPRARRAVVSSFTKLATSDRARLMTPEQRQVLIEHFIDLYQQAPPRQQPEVVAAMRKMGATDAAAVLQGKGLDSDEALDINREMQKAIRETSAQVKEAEARETAQVNKAQAGAQAPTQEPPQPQAQAQQAQAQGSAPAQGVGQAGPVPSPTSSPETVSN